MTTMGHITGIGVDIVDAHRLGKALARTPRLMNRLFTPDEQAYAHKQRHPFMSLAKRFAAKEAFSKAAGWGIGAKLAWTDIAVHHHPTGQPHIVLSSAAHNAVHKAVGGDFHVICSLTDEKAGSCAMAQAFVIIQRVSSLY